MRMTQEQADWIAQLLWDHLQVTVLRRLVPGSLPVSLLPGAVNFFTTQATMGPPMLFYIDGLGGYGLTLMFSGDGPFGVALEALHPDTLPALREAIRRVFGVSEVTLEARFNGLVARLPAATVSHVVQFLDLIEPSTDEAEDWVEVLYALARAQEPPVPAPRATSHPAMASAYGAVQLPMMASISSTAPAFASHVRAALHMAGYTQPLLPASQPLPRPQNVEPPPAAEPVDDPLDYAADVLRRIR